MMWFGFGWSGLVLGVLLAADPTARSLAVIAALVAVAGGWLLLARSLVAADRQNGEADNLLAARHEIVERSGQAIVHVSSEATRQVEAMRQEIRRAQDIFSEAIDKLVASFHGMNTQIQRQQLLGMQVVRGGPAQLDRNLVFLSEFSAG